MLKPAQETAKQQRRFSFILNPDDVTTPGEPLDFNLWRATMDHILLKLFTSPDETRSAEKVTFELLRLGVLTVGQASYEPGWKGATEVGPLVGRSSCHVQ